MGIGAEGNWFGVLEASGQESTEHGKFVGWEASRGGMKVGRTQDTLLSGLLFGITPPTFILPLEAPDPW